MANIFGFVGHLAEQTAQGLSAWRMGKEQNAEIVRRRQIEDEERTRKRQQEQQDDQLRELHTQKARLDLAEAQKRAKASHEGHLHYEGAEFGPDSDAARKGMLDFRRQYEAAGRAPRDPTSGPDPYARRRSEMDYWADRASALVAESGPDAINVAMDRNKNPEFREALRSGRAQKGSFYDAIRRQPRAGAGGGKGPVPQELLDEWAAEGLSLTQVYEKAKALGYDMR